VEVLYPIEDPILRREILENVLYIYLKDTQQGHVLEADGTYKALKDKLDSPDQLFSIQEWLLDGRTTLQRAKEEPINISGST
jgi:polyphosphate kinase